MIYMCENKIQIECSNERFYLLHLSYILKKNLKKNIQIILKHFLMMKISISVFFMV